MLIQTVLESKLDNYAKKKSQSNLLKYFPSKVLNDIHLNVST